MIIADKLGKEYGSFTAVADVSFSVEKGEVFGLLGPNGAGKSTTVQMLIGLIRRSRGWALVAGYDPAVQPREVHRRIGVVFETPNLYDRLTVEYNLMFYAQLGQVGRTGFTRVVDRLDLGSVLSRRVDQLSKGWRQRVLIGRALLHDPEVLFLDEPTSGLDPNSSRLIRQMVKDLQAEGRTICLTTHDMHEADELCGRIGLVYRGRLAALDTPAALKGSDGRRLVVEYKEGTGGVARRELSMEAPEAAEWVYKIMREGRCVSMQTRQYTLADVFYKLTGGELS